MNTQSKTPLFLMEIVIMLFVFAISASICLKVFVYGEKISQEGYNLDQACFETQKAAEYWQNTKGNMEETAQLLQASIEGDELKAYFDEDWNSTQKGPIFTLTMKTRGAYAKIVVKDQEKELFSLETEAVIFGE
ncbi:hypothetical protein CLNEO_12070 [Anaerotignum neopropionicum]|uniref:Uncharacterized protein n=1 Tax=Anaerotignum neopropionicum TaxID=36847 RepID=A0A136WFB0_9FIRM|nr:hypothetical protein [Anaerotignum neopropionicum]KXL53236.1 hypothetical protein CLNEO_12070 [Anaerotignum neopropionicum]